MYFYTLSLDYFHPRFVLCCENFFLEQKMDSQQEAQAKVEQQQQQHPPAGAAGASQFADATTADADDDVVAAKLSVEEIAAIVKNDEEGPVPGLHNNNDGGHGGGSNRDEEDARPAKVPKIEPGAPDGATDPDGDDHQPGAMIPPGFPPPNGMPFYPPPPGHMGMNMNMNMNSPPGGRGRGSGSGSGSASASASPGGPNMVPMPHPHWMHHGGYGFPPPPYGYPGGPPPPPPYPGMPYPGMMMMPPNMAQMEFDRRNMQQKPQSFGGGGAGGNGGEDEDGNGENEGVGDTTQPSNSGDVPRGGKMDGAPSPGGPPPPFSPLPHAQFVPGPHGGDPAAAAAAAAAMNPYAYTAMVAGYGWPPPYPNARGQFHAAQSAVPSPPPPRRARSDKKPQEPQEPPQPVPKLDREYGKVVDMTMETDPVSVSKLQNLARRQIEFFEATEKDVTAGARGRNFPITEGQVGIRCKHCKDEPFQNRGRASCYFPTRYSLIYQTGINMTSTHLLNQCTKIPQDLRDELLRLKDQRSNAGAGKGYWGKSAKDLGIIETTKGLRFTE